MNLYIDKEGIENIFQNIKLTDAVFSFFFKNRENLYLTEDASKGYESQVKDLILKLSTGIKTNNKKFQKQAEKYYKISTNQSANQYDNDLNRLLLPTEGCNYSNEIPEKEKSNTFYLSEHTEPKSIWVNNKSEDAYTTLNDWLNHNLFRRVNLDNNGWKNFIDETFDDDTLSKLTDVIIYDPYFLFNIYIHGEPVLIKRIKENGKKNINIVVFTDSIEKYYHPLKNYTDKNPNFIFIQIPKGAHDRFIIANNMFVSSGKGFVLDSDKSTDIIAYKEGCIDKNIATLWKNKINNLNEYVSNEPVPVFLSKNKNCNLLDLTNLQQVEEPSGPNVPDKKQLSGDLVGALKNWLNTKSFLAYDTKIEIKPEHTLNAIAEKILNSQSDAKLIFIKSLIYAYSNNQIPKFREVLIKLHNNYPQNGYIKKLLNISDYNFSINKEYICDLIQKVLGEISVDASSFSSAQNLINLFLNKIKGNELGSYNLGSLKGNINITIPSEISTALDDIKKTFDHTNFKKIRLIEPIIYLARFKYIEKKS